MKRKKIIRFIPIVIECLGIVILFYIYFINKSKYSF